MFPSLLMRLCQLPLCQHQRRFGILLTDLRIAKVRLEALSELYLAVQKPVHNRGALNAVRTNSRKALKSELLVLIRKLVKRREVAHLNPLRSHENAGVSAALKIPRAFHTPIVLSRGLIKPDAHPRPNLAYDLGHVTHERHFASPRVTLRRQQSTSGAGLDAALLDLAVRGVNLLLLYGRSIRVEAAKLVGFLPS